MGMSAIVTNHTVSSSSWQATDIGVISVCSMVAFSKQNVTTFEGLTGPWDGIAPNFRVYNSHYPSCCHR